MNKIVIALILIFCLIFIGTMGYMILEKWSFFDSIYMTIITISTVGFSEINSMSIYGRIMTMVLITIGIGIGSFTISNLSAFIIEGHIHTLLKGRKMEKRINILKNHIIVCGYGRTGIEIVETLRTGKHALIIIENDEDRIEEALNKKLLVVNGNATDDDVLRKCGVEKANGLITALGNDADNLYIALTVRQLNPKLKIIARGIDETSKKKLLLAGADNVVSPFSIAGRRMASLVTKPQIIEFLEVMMYSGELELKIEQVMINHKSHIVNKRLNQSNIKSETDGASVIGIRKVQDNKMIINPSGDILLEDGDILIALGNNEQIAKLKEIATKKRFFDLV